MTTLMEMGISIGGAGIRGVDDYHVDQVVPAGKSRTQIDTVKWKPDFIEVVRIKTVTQFPIDCSTPFISEIVDARTILIGFYCGLELHEIRLDIISDDYFV